MKAESPAEALQSQTTVDSNGGENVNSNGGDTTSGVTPDSVEMPDGF